MEWRFLELNHWEMYSRESHKDSHRHFVVLNASSSFVPSSLLRRIQPDRPFRILEPRHQEIGEFHLVQERLATDFETTKLWKDRSGVWLQQTGRLYCISSSRIFSSPRRPWEKAKAMVKAALKESKRQNSLLHCIIEMWNSESVLSHLVFWIAKNSKSK